MKKETFSIKDASTWISYNTTKFRLLFNVVQKIPKICLKYVSIWLIIATPCQFLRKLWKNSLLWGSHAQSLSPKQLTHISHEEPLTYQGKTIYCRKKMKLMREKFYESLRSDIYPGLIPLKFQNYNLASTYCNFPSYHECIVCHVKRSISSCSCSAALSSICCTRLCWMRLPDMLGRSSRLASCCLSASSMYATLDWSNRACPTVSVHTIPWSSPSFTTFSPASS